MLARADFSAEETRNRTSIVRRPGLPQRVNFREFVADGVAEMADGAFHVAFEYTGPDQEYVDFLIMAHGAQQLDQDVTKKPSGWMIESNAVRMPVKIARRKVRYPDVTSALIAEERAAEFEKDGQYFETRYVLSLTFLPPSNMGRRFEQYLFGKRQIGKQHTRTALLDFFIKETDEFTSALSHFLKFKRLTNRQHARFLHYCITGEDREVNLPEPGTRLLNYALAATTMKPHKGIVGNLHTRVVGIHGFPEQGTCAQMFDPVLQLPFPLRMTHRFIPIGRNKAIKELQDQAADWGQLNWFNPKRMLWGMFSTPTGVDANSKDVVAYNNDATDQMASVEREITTVRKGRTRSGYYTFTVVVQHPDETQVEKNALLVVETINRLGFTAVIETDNLADAWGGTWPGHPRNPRKPKLTSRTFCNLMPTSTKWQGYVRHPSPLYPPDSGPLLETITTGDTPFFLTPRLHFLVIGPTDAGKTTIFNSMAIAHLQYPNPHVNFFDFDAGAAVTTAACDGAYFDLGTMQYAPLAHIHKQEERDWALRFLKTLATLQKFEMNPIASADLHRALTDLSAADIEQRTITTLLGQLQTSQRGLEEAIGFYAGNQPGAILDGHYSPLAESRWLTFDMKEILKRGPEVSKPVLMAQIHALEERMDAPTEGTSGHQTLMLFDEGWQVSGEELLERYVEESSATARKKVVSLGLVLHSPGDLAVFKHRDRLVANFDTYIFLPNPRANDDELRPHYAALGLGSRVIRMIAEEMRPRRDYLVKEGNRMRLFRLPWGPMQQALVGLNGRDHKRRVNELRHEYGEVWVPQLLKEHNHPELVAQWERRYQEWQKEAA